MANAALPCGPAPWRALFLAHVSSMSQPTFVLSTLHPAQHGSHHASPWVPRARTCIFRGLWGTLPANSRNPALRNPTVFESDLPVLTTDVRMEKAGEISGSAPPRPLAAGESGGGGPVEAVWWSEAHATQWRLRGTAWVLGPDIEGDGDGARAVREALLPRMRKAEGGLDNTTGSAEEAWSTDWSWTREVTGHFGNLSPAMRGTFRHPPPGQPVALSVAPGLGLGQKVEDLNDQVARTNFRVVVIVPGEVDRVDLSDSTNPRRWLYTFRDGAEITSRCDSQATGRWEEVEVWP